MKVTDLDNFALDQIYSPYESMLPDLVNHKNEKLTGFYGLDTAVYDLKNNPEWRKLVVQRLDKCGFTFPPYIIHKLVDYLRSFKGIKL